MAHHDFAPAWLNFPTPPSSTKSSRNFDRNPENVLRTENRYEANRRRYTFSDGFDPNIGRFNGGYFGRRERNGWRSQGRSYPESMNHRGGYYGRGSRPRASTFHCGRGQGLRESNVPDNEAVRREDKEVPRHFKAEDFPSLNPQYEREPNKNKPLAAGVWEYPLNPKSRSQKMLVIKKGSTKDLQISGFPVVGGLHSPPVRNRSTSFYKGLVPVPVPPPTKPTQWKSQAKEIKFGNQFPHQSACGVGSFSPFRSTAKAFPVPQSSDKEFSWSKSSSPVDTVGPPRLKKLTRMRIDKKSEFLKALKQDRVEEERKDENHAGQEKGDESFNLNNSNSPHREREINQNFENEIPQENGNASVPRADILSSSLEAEHRLLKEMGWQEDNENDESYAPLTEEEMREFRAIRDQLQKNGLRRNSILKNSLVYGFKFSPWKNSTFTPALDNEDSETTSSDTSDDDDL